jgi:hypothetical protein
LALGLGAARAGAAQCFGLDVGGLHARALLRVSRIGCGAVVGAGAGVLHACITWACILARQAGGPLCVLLLGRGVIRGSYLARVLRLRVRFVYYIVAMACAGSDNAGVRFIWVVAWRIIRRVSYVVGMAR